MGYTAIMGDEQGGKDGERITKAVQTTISKQHPSMIDMKVIDHFSCVWIHPISPQVVPPPSDHFPGTCGTEMRIPRGSGPR